MFISHHRSSLMVVIVSALGAACSDESSPATAMPSDPPAATSDCSAQTLEDDIAYSMPLTGPGVDPETGALRAPAEGESFVVGATYLQLVSDAEAPATLVSLSQKVVAQLFMQPGLLGVQTAQSDRCGTARTFTVWENEEALVDFVVSPAHLEAMRRRDEVIRKGWTGTYLAKSASELTFQHSLRSLESRD